MQETFLTFASKYSTQKCPHCSKHIPLGHLRINALMQNVLEQVSEDSDKVKLLGNGTFKELDKALAIRHDRKEEEDEQAGVAANGAAGVILGDLE